MDDEVRKRAENAKPKEPAKRRVFGAHLALVALCGWLAQQAALAEAAMSLPDGIENVLGFVPKSTFKCERDGYFGDTDNDCRIFHLCQRQVNLNGRTEWRHWTYACGNQTMFNQLTLTCAFVDEAIPCKHASQFQYLNEVIHKPREPFLTDADVTSGVSYYSNRVMSDGARTRAFEDSRLMAQLGGGQAMLAALQTQNAHQQQQQQQQQQAQHRQLQRSAHQKQQQQFFTQQNQLQQQQRQQQRARQDAERQQRDAEEAGSGAFNSIEQPESSAPQSNEQQQHSFQFPSVHQFAQAAQRQQHQQAFVIHHQPQQQASASVQRFQAQPNAFQLQAQHGQLAPAAPSTGRSSAEAEVNFAPALQFQPQFKQLQSALAAPQLERAPQQQAPVDNQPPSSFDFAIATHHQLGSSSSAAFQEASFTGPLSPAANLPASHDFALTTTSSSIGRPDFELESRRLLSPQTTLPTSEGGATTTQQSAASTTTNAAPTTQAATTQPTATTTLAATTSSSAATTSALATAAPTTTTTTPTSTTTTGQAATEALTSGTSEPQPPRTTLASTPSISQQQQPRRFKQAAPVTGRTRDQQARAQSRRPLFDHHHHQFQSTRISRQPRGQEPALVMRRGSPQQAGTSGTQQATAGPQQGSAPTQQAAGSAAFEGPVSFWRKNPFDFQFMAPKFESMLTRRRV